MRRALLHTVLIAAAVIGIQLLIPDYFISVVVMVLIGVLIAIATHMQKVFGRAFLAGLLAGIALWFMIATHNAWPLQNMMEAAEIAPFWLMVIFILFTGLNVGFCVLAGHSLIRVLGRK